jgi:hypothetical protein
MNSKHLLYHFIIPLLFFVSCKKFVEVNVPETQQVTSTVFEDNQSATAALFNIFPAMMSINNPTPYEISLYMGLSADELTNYSNLPGLSQFYQNTLNSLDAPSNVLWAQAYNYIYQANAVYEGCNNSTKLTPAVKQQLMGEALFIRAFWNFYLVNLYGDVPNLTTTDYIKNKIIKRSDKAGVYNQIISDLKIAEENLSETYLDPNYNTTEERLRPNKYTASALLARVYLFTKNYIDAEEQSDMVISNTSLYEPVSLDATFLKNSKEAIWQLAMSGPNYNSINTTEGRGYILSDDPSASYDNNNSSALSKQQLDAFEDGDLRKTSWISKYTNSTVTPNIDYFFPNKYKIQFGTDIYEYTMVMRLGEQFLIRAEARAQQNNLNGAIDDIDIIRYRANLPLIKNINPGISKDALLRAILKERQTELFTEWGHRWLDLKRTEKVNDVMSVVTALKGGNWSTNFQLWPIPAIERQNDQNLTQNPGYN